MKKVLLATTALALSAGVAYAEVSLSGSARLGMVYTGKVAGSPAVAGTKDTYSAGVKTTVAGTVVAADIATARTAVQTAKDTLAIAKATNTGVAAAEGALKDRELELAARLGVAAVAEQAATTRLDYRTRISLTGSGETDSGLSYSATIRLQDLTTAASVQAIGVTVSGAFGSLTFGTSSSAAEYAVGDLAGVGYAGAGSGNETTFLTGALAMYTYTAGSVSIFASAGQIDSDDYSIGASFSSNGLTAGIGYEDNGEAQATSASASYTMGETTAKVVYMDSDVVGKETGLSVASTMGAVSVAAYYKSTDPVLAAAARVNNYGVGAAYDLGGGAAIKGGIAKLGDQTRADLGMTFSF